MMNPDTCILYVEDDPFSRQVMELLLVRSLKFKHVTVFEDSTNFMQNLTELPQKPQLIFLDVHMRPNNGFVLLDMLRKHDMYQQTKVVAVTASVMNEEVAQLRKAGFDGVLAKPIDQQTFPETLARILDGERIWNVL